MMRISKTNNIVLFCSNLQIGKIIPFFSEKGLKTDLLVWKKMNPAPLCNGKYVSDLEYIVYVHDKGSPFNNDAPYSYKKKCKEYPIMTDSDKQHPTQKPIKLMEELIEVHSFENDVILDPFMGSGTTGVACVNLNRNFIGCEIDEHYINIAENRIRTAQKEKEITLF